MTATRRSTHISSTKVPGIMAWIIKANGTKIGVVRLHADGGFNAVATCAGPGRPHSHRLGTFSSKVEATDAIYNRVMSE